MALLQILALAWDISEREVQRTLGRGVAGFVRRGRGHYRAIGPLTAARLRRVRPLDPRLPVAVWISGGCTMWQAARLCSGPKIVEAITRAAPHMREARAVLLALETRMARDYRAARPGYFARRQETAVAFADYRKRIEVEIGEATYEPRFVELRNAILRLQNSGDGFPTRPAIAAELGLSERMFFYRYTRATLRRALLRSAREIKVKTAVEHLLEAMQRATESGLGVTPDDIAEELGYGRASEMFKVFTRDEYAEAFEQLERGTIAQPVAEPSASKDTGQLGRCVSIRQGQSKTT